MKFYLGTHMPHWLKKPGVPPLFVSHRRLQRDKTMPVATGTWALDSGGFTELSMYGEWRTSSSAYVDAVRRYDAEIGNLDWAAPQDWMCEPWIISKTGLSVAEHQARTTDNLLELRSMAPELTFVPVLQGWTIEDYHAHVEQYARVGINLENEPTVGIGSVCRRQATDEIGEIVASLSGIRLHGFGVKGDGLRLYGWALHSADSMAWSARGRRIQPCPHGRAKSCANCYPHALAWRRRAITTVSHRPIQLTLT